MWKRAGDCVPSQLVKTLSQCGLNIEWICVNHWLSMINDGDWRMADWL